MASHLKKTLEEIEALCPEEIDHWKGLHSIVPFGPFEEANRFALIMGGLTGRPAIDFVPKKLAKIYREVSDE